MGESSACCVSDGGSSFRKDHAPGSVLVEEAGGIITDSRGQSLDFGLGRTMGENYGFVAAGKEAHSRVLEAVKKAQELEAVESS